MGQEQEQQQEYGHGAGKCNICSPNNVVVWEGAICLNQIRPDQKEGEGAEILLENFLSSQINLLIIEGSTFGIKRQGQPSIIVSFRVCMCVFARHAQATPPLIL